MAREAWLSESLGLNLNGDLSDDRLVEVALRADEVGAVIWIGENPLFKDPFYVAELISDYVSVPIGFGIISPLRRSCSDIIERIRNLMNKAEILVGVAPGTFKNPKLAVEITLKCLERLRELNIPLFCGCSSPIITSKASAIADGILYNYGHPEHLRWISSFEVREVIRVAFAPSLILPSEFEQDLLLACAIVACSSGKFVRAFGFEYMCRYLSKLDFGELISIRQRGGNLFECVEFRTILNYRKVLLDRFSISGDIRSVRRRIRDLLYICDHVVLGDPFFRDSRSLESIDILKYRFE